MIAVTQKSFIAYGGTPIASTSDICPPIWRWKTEMNEDFITFLHLIAAASTIYVSDIATKCDLSHGS